MHPVSVALVIISMAGELEFVLAGLKREAGNTLDWLAGRLKTHREKQLFTLTFMPRINHFEF